jgi:hypothetical protein
VVAFSWPESKFSGSQISQAPHRKQKIIYFLKAHRFAWLEGDIANTDESGIAQFKELTIFGANSDLVYIFFSVNGILVSPWGIEQPTYASVLDI